MRILFIVDDYLPSHRAAALLIYELALGFVRAGHEAFVLTPSHTSKSAQQFRVEDGISVLRIKCPKTKVSSAYRRGVNELALSPLMWSRGKDAFKKWKIDLIAYYSPSIFFWSLVKRLKELWGCPAFLILRDIFPKYLTDIGYMRDGLAYRYLSWHEKQNYDVADLILAQSSGDLSSFQGGDRNRTYKTVLLYNWASATPPESLPEMNFRRKLGLSDQVVFIYGGNFGIANEIGNLLHLTYRMRQLDGVHFVFIGQGYAQAQMRRFLAEKNLSNATILAPVSHSEYLGILQEADVGLISLSGRLKNHNFPGKLLSCLRMSKPALISTNPGNDVMQLVQSKDAGLVSSAGDIDSLYDNAMRLANDPCLRKSMGRNGHALLQRDFSVDRAIGTMLASYAALGKTWSSEYAHVSASMPPHVDALPQSGD